MDFGVTAANQLTIKGAINALSAVLGGFQIDNDRLQSLAQTGGVPNISLNGTSGTASITGSFRSNGDNGYAIRIDPDQRAMLLQGAGKVWGVFSSDSDGSGGALDLRGQGNLSAHFNPNGLSFINGNESLGLRTKYGDGKLQLGTAFRADDQNGVTRIKATGLPNNASSAGIGNIYVDNNGFLKRS